MQLGKALETVHAELLPEDKTRLINDFKREGPTAMIGDGLNDAPALATADIGISMGISGSALAIETGDVILMSNDIRKIPKAIRLARKANMKVIENVILSVIPRTAILGLAFAGHPLVWAAVLADVGACVLVILNSMLLLRGTSERKGKKAGKFSATHCSSKHECCHVSSHSDQHGNHSRDLGCNHENSHSHHHHHHVHEDHNSHKKTHDGCLPQNCASMCDSGKTNSSSCKKSKLVDSSSKLDDSAGSVRPYEHEHCVHNQSAQHDHHTHSSCTDHHIEDTHCSPENTQEFCSSWDCASNCQSSKCEKTECTNSPSSLDGSAGSIENHESGCCTHNSRAAQHNHEIQIPKCNSENSHMSNLDHHIDDGCCSHKNTQKVSLPHSKCHSKTYISSPCGKTKCADSTARQDGSSGSLELLQDQKIKKNCTKDECNKRVAMIDGCAKAKGHLEIKHHCNTHFFEKNGTSNRDGHEGAHPDSEAWNGDSSGSINTTIVELEADHLHSKPANTCKPLEKRETGDSCKSCKVECSELKLKQCCPSLEKRGMGGCCKSYTKECCRRRCRRHSDIGTTLRGGLKEIIIE